MKRRTFFTAGAIALALPATAHAAGLVEYQPGAVEKALAEGKTVLVEYSATWCSTCKRQERVINTLRGTDPAYDANIKFIKVDWDTYRRHPVTTDRRIPRRSTLILLRGNDELGRIVAGTSQSQIKSLMDLGLPGA